MSATRKLQRSISRAKGLTAAHIHNSNASITDRKIKDSEAKRFAIIPTSRKKTRMHKKLVADEAAIRAANDAAVKADPELATMTDEQLAERNLRLATSKEAQEQGFGADKHFVFVPPNSAAQS